MPGRAKREAAKVSGLAWRLLGDVAQRWSWRTRWQHRRKQRASKQSARHAHDEQTGRGERAREQMSEQAGRYGCCADGVWRAGDRSLAGCGFAWVVSRKGLEAAQRSDGGRYQGASGAAKVGQQSDGNTLTMRPRQRRALARPFRAVAGTCWRRRRPWPRLWATLGDERCAAWQPVRNVPGRLADEVQAHRRRRPRETW
jgi:hypothetical protein